MSDEKKSAFVAVVGRPSAGKSTLVNLLCGQKVAIVSSVPQTTRNAIRGILNSGPGQLVFVDTPGRHASEKKLNKKLMQVSDRALDDCELILYVLDASRAPGPEETAIAVRLVPHQARVVAAINKIDLPVADCGKVLSFLAEQLPEVPVSRCLKISSLKNEGIPDLLSVLYEMAPAGEPVYPDDIYTDQEIPFRIAEIIREKAMNRLREELPHSIYVQVEDAELKQQGGKQVLWVRAFIVAERESQKGMIVGRGGEMIRAIRLAALKDLNNIFEWKVDLDLRVKTGKDWRHNDAILKKITEN
ncbi:MAG: GTPase Era [Treponema sp.]|nr:GTPase Era [Treponema sp.]